MALNALKFNHLVKLGLKGLNIGPVRSSEQTVCVIPRKWGFSLNLAFIPAS